VKVRLTISFLWNILIESSKSSKGVPSMIIQCEKEVRDGILSSCEYAEACAMASKYTRGSLVN